MISTFEQSFTIFSLPTQLATSLSTWFTHHPLWHDLILSFGPLLVVYGVSKGRAKIGTLRRESAAKDLEYEVSRAKRLHGEPYLLQLYAFAEFLDVGKTALWTLGCYVAARPFVTQFVDNVILSCGIGFTLGRLSVPIDVLKMLRGYPTSVRHAEQKILALRNNKRTAID